MHGVTARLDAFPRLRPAFAGRGCLETLVPSFDGVPIAFDSHGSGSPAIVFVHGWSCDRSDFVGQLVLASQVVRVDLAGHGASGRGRSDWTIASFGQDVAAVVGSLGLRRVVLVGHSMGGDVVLDAAFRLPGVVCGLVWVDVYDQLGFPREVESRLAPFRSSFAPAVEEFVRPMFAPSADPSLVSRIVTRMASAPPEIALPCLRAAWNAHAFVPGMLRELGLPVVSISPADVPCNLGSYGIEVVRMAGVRHFPHLEDPAAFNRVLSEIVSRWNSVPPQA